MPLIRANRESIDDRFSVLGFTVRSESPLIEVGIATDPALFRPENRSRRTRKNFYSSRAVGAIRAPRGEAVYLVPPDVLSNFVGQRRVYFGLATYRESSGGRPDFVNAPSEGSMYVDLAGLTERGLRRMVGRGNGSAGYGATNGRDPSLEWGGDGVAVNAGPGGNGAAAAARSPGAPAAAPAGPNGAAAAPAPYDDGFGNFPEPAATATSPASPAPASTPAPTPTPTPTPTPANGAAPGAAPAAAVPQSYRSPSRSLATRALEIIAPFYDPADPSSALTCQANAFSQAREEWFAGVPNTTIFPHSAICLLEMKDSSGSVVSYGTGFYIGRNRILTCAHNLRGKASVDVVPACNDRTEPYGRFNVSSASWRLPASYDGSGAYDLAVIDNVPNEAPGGRWFDALEELNQSRPEGVVVCGYSRKSDRVPDLTAAMNGRTQHLHAGYIAQLRGEVFDYPILTLHRASGSPVYYLSDRDGEMKAYVVGVHISGELATTQELNTGCRLTEAKIGWIEGRTTTLGQRVAQAAAVAPRRSAYALEATAPQAEIKLRVFIPCRALPALSITGRRAFAGDDRGFSYSGGTSRAELVGQVVVGAAGTAPSVSLVSRSFGQSEEYNHDDLVDVPGKPDWYKTLREGYTTIASDALAATDDNLSIELGAGGSTTESVFSALENTTVVTIRLAGALPLMTGAPAIDATLYVHLKSVGGRIRALVHGSHDGFPAYELYVNRELVYSYDPVAAGSSPDALLPPEDVTASTSYVDVGPASTAQALGLARAQAARQLSGQSFAVHWDTTPYYPQSTTMSCWAASAAMVVGWRDGRTVSDQEIADAVPVIDAYRKGLWPRDRQTLADAWELVAEPPASYTIDAWRGMLERHGPIYIDMTANTAGQGGHARVLVGMESDGAPDGSDTVMFMHDPWPGTPGRIRVSFNDFLALYERRVDNSGGTLEYQLLHSAYVPAHLRPSLAAPFALATAQSLEEPAAAPAPAADDAAAANTYRLAPPPEPLVQQQGLKARALLHPAVVPIATTVLGTTMTRVLNNAGDITWELDQMRGLKHPNNAAPSPLPPAQDGTVIRLTDWPYVENYLSDRISAGFEINWQYNGVSVGNVQITNVATNDAVGWGLDVKAHIMDDDVVYPRDNPRHAAIKVRLEYRFTRAIGSDSIAIRDVHLFGNGQYNLSGRWEQ